MYRWQTLTLARVERILFREDCRFGGEAAMLDAAKNVLYYIGQQHFPEPEIADPPRPANAGQSIDLIWRADDREMVVSVSSSAGPNVAAVRAYTRTIGDGIAPPDEPADRDSIREITHWLLFGLRPPKPAAVAMAPKLGDPMSKRYSDAMSRAQADALRGH